MTVPKTTASKVNPAKEQASSTKTKTAAPTTRTAQPSARATAKSTTKSSPSPLKPGSLKLGYARVSSDDQNLDLQRDALTRAGCARVYQEKESGGKVDRVELLRLLDTVRAGDTLVVWRLDRLGRSLKHLIATVEELEARGVGFQSVTEHIDTTTSGGKLVFHIFAALAEFERTLIRERTRAGLSAARARGRQGGRPKVLSDDKQKMAQALRDDPTHSIQSICKMLGISRTTFYRYTGERSNDTSAAGSDTTGNARPPLLGRRAK